jgi:ribosome biogenesis GTPase
MTGDRAALVPFGWNARVEALLAGVARPGRVVGVTRSTCRVATAAGEIVATAETLPAVGDWVAVDDSDPPAVVTVAERWSALTRMDPHLDRLQVLAANVDLVLVTCPADRPSIDRVERETVLAWDAGAEPVVLVTKSDLDRAGADALVAALRARLVGVEVIETSALANHGDDDGGLAAVAALLAPDRTAVVLGPSGAGKSTLINAWLGEERLPTGAVRDEDARGRHTTTARELVVLPGGGVVIDTPGLRSLGLGTDREVGMAAAFSDIEALAEGCRFRDCAHEAEPGCAVRAAVEAGELDADRFASYAKLARELAYEERRVDPAAAREQREYWKRIHKAARRDRRKP